MKKLCIRLSILTAALATAGGIYAAPVVLNGSFESPDISGGTTSSGGTSWTASSGTGVFLVDNVSGLGQTPYGSQFVALNRGQSDSQTITGFQLGSIYTFTAYFADLLNGTSPALTVTLSGVVSLSQTFTAPVGGNYGTNTIPFTFVSFSIPVLTTSGAITLALTNASTGGTIAVDNVSVVPEPSSVLASVLGLGMVGYAVAKRRPTTLA